MGATNTGVHAQDPISKTVLCPSLLRELEPDDRQETVVDREAARAQHHHDAQRVCGVGRWLSRIGHHAIKRAMASRPRALERAITAQTSAPERLQTPWKPATPKPGSAIEAASRDVLGTGFRSSHRRRRTKCAKHMRFNWRRERDSNPRRAFDPYALSRGAPSTTRPSLRSLKMFVFQLVGPPETPPARVRGGHDTEGPRGRQSGLHTVRRERTNSCTEASAASSASGLLPPAWAKSARPPPRPPTWAATAPASSPALIRAV